jgi:hypothetical protein
MRRRPAVFERLFQKLKYTFDLEKRISLIRSSDTPGLAEYLRAIKAEASTHMEEDGRVYIKIIDPPSKGTLLEEFAHALQYVKTGNVPLSHDDQERRMREFEVAKCLRERADQLKLPADDRDHLVRAIERYGVRDAHC